MNTLVAVVVYSVLALIPIGITLEIKQLFPRLNWVWCFFAMLAILCLLDIFIIGFLAFGPK